jgi:hypothetical protein
LISKRPVGTSPNQSYPWIAQCLWDVGTEKANSLPALLNLLRLRFGSDNQRERYRTELRTRRQQPDEPLQAVYQDIRQLLTLAFHGPSTETTETIARDAFLDSLSDQELALKVRTHEVTTLEDALKFATRLVAYAAARTTNDNVRAHQPRGARGAHAQEANESPDDSRLTWLVALVNSMSQKLDRLMAASRTSPTIPQTNSASVNIQPLIEA